MPQQAPVENILSKSISNRSDSEYKQKVHLSYFSSSQFQCILP